MKRTQKPVHNCYACELNLGSRCWAYECPRDQWSRRNGCPGFNDQDLHVQFREWQQSPHVRTARDLRRDNATGRNRTEEHHNHFGGGTLPKSTKELHRAPPA